MKALVLNLSHVRDAHAFEESEEIIQLEAMRGFFRHLHDSYKNAKGFPQQRRKYELSSRIRYHDTIAVFGPRGSGKTTFILNAFRVITESKVREVLPESSDEYRELSHTNLAVLDILDPTLIEEKEHVFVNIISCIKRRVDDVSLGYENKALQSPDRISTFYDGERTGDDGRYQDWVDSLRKLAAGLPVLEGIGTDELKTEKWHDPVHVMEKGLRNTEAASKLEVNFHDFVERSLELLNKKAFLLAFDDIDTQFSKGWDVLEVIRKYLTTPQIITVVSGDLSLYAIQIRDKQWANFSDKLLRCERHRTSDFRSMVDQLEDQYLLKIFKPERRLGLRTLQELRELNYHLEVNFNGQNVKLPNTVERILQSLCKEIFFLRSEQELYTSHILREPVRAVVQIIYRYLDLFYRTRIDSDQSSQDVDNARQDFIASLIDIFWVPLQDFGFDPPTYKSPSCRTILNTIVTTLVKNDLLFQGYRLKPEHLDRRLNSAMIAVGSALADLMRRRPYLYFDYFIKVGLTREFSLLLPTKAEFGPSLHDYLRVTGIDTGEDAVTISRFSCGYLRALAETGVVWQGTVALMGLTETARIGITVPGPQDQYIRYHYDVPDIELVATSNRYPKVFYDNVKGDGKDVYSYINRIDTLSDNIWSWHKYLVTLPVSVLLNKKGERLPVASIYNLIAVIGRVVEVVARDKDESYAKSSYSDIVLTIKKHAQLRDYRLPAWEARGMPPDIGGGDTVEGESKDAYIGRGFLKSIRFWANEHSGAAEGIPVHVIAKMTTRFSYTLSSIKDVGAQELYLGHLLHRFIVALLNAVLVEEQLHRQSSRTSLKNPVRSDHVFIQNLKAVFGDWSLPKADVLDEKETSKDEIRSKSPFFCWVASCPLWIPYLNPEPTGGSGESIIDFFRRISLQPVELGSVDYRGKLIDIETLFPLLNSVLVQRPTTALKSEGGTKPRERAKVKFDKDRNLTDEERKWLIQEITNEVEKSKKSGKIPKIDQLVVEVSRRFFKGLGQSRRPQGKSSLRDQVEGVLSNVAAVRVEGA